MEMTETKSKLGPVLLFAGLLLIAGNIIYLGRAKKSDAPAFAPDTAGAKFELMSGVMGLETYNQIKLGIKNKSEDRLADTIIQNDIAGRLSAGTIVPDYTKAITQDVFIKSFLPVYKKKQVHLNENFVAFLIIKQTRGTTRQVSININHVVLGGPEEILDPIDLVSDEPADKWNNSFHKTKPQQLNLGATNAKDSWLIPIYICNDYSSLIHIDGEEGHWSVVAGTLNIPVTLQYAQQGKKTETISLSSALERPIDISK
jgi:hypothetical protein